jgi:hypothetical protein
MEKKMEKMEKTCRHPVPVLAEPGGKAVRRARTSWRAGLAKSSSRPRPPRDRQGTAQGKRTTRPAVGSHAVARIEGQTAPSAAPRARFRVQHSRNLPPKQRGRILPRGGAAWLDRTGCDGHGSRPPPPPHPPPAMPPRQRGLSRPRRGQPSRHSSPRTGPSRAGPARAQKPRAGPRPAAPRRSRSMRKSAAATPAARHRAARPRSRVERHGRLRVARAPHLPGSPRHPLPPRIHIHISSIHPD